MEDSNNSAEKPKDLFIIGGGQAAKDLMHIIADINKIKKEWNVLGYIDDDPKLLNTSLYGYQVLGGIEYLENMKDVSEKYVACIIGNPMKPGTRERVIKKVLNKGFKFPNIIHPTCDISEYASIGQGNVLCFTAYLGPDTKLGDFNFLNKRVQLGHDVEVGSFCTIQSNVALVEGLKINNNIYIGTGAIIYNHATLEDGCIIGAGSVVSTNIPAYTIAMGNPARVIRSLKIENIQKEENLETLK